MQILIFNTFKIFKRNHLYVSGTSLNEIFENDLSQIKPFKIKPFQIKPFKIKPFKIKPFQIKLFLHDQIYSLNFPQLFLLMVYQAILNQHLYQISSKKISY